MDNNWPKVLKAFHQIAHYVNNNKILISMSIDRNGVIISVSKVFANVNEIKGSDWYDHRQYQPTWNSPDNYFLLKKVGRGKYSTVFKGLYKKKKEVAIKILVPLDPKRYLREIKIMYNLATGPNIVKLVDLVRDPATGIYSFISEWVDFYDWRSLYMTLTIDDIRLYMFKLLKALNYSHSNGIMHRDIKPQNIAIDKERKKLRLLDWGLADFYHPKQKYNSHVATRIFKSPELLINYPYYDYSMDMWSTGLTFSLMMFKKFILECGENDADQLLKVADLVGGQGILNYADNLRVELDEETRSDLRRRKGTGLEAYAKKYGKNICTPEALDLLNKLMVIDHRERITASDAMKHPFFKPLKGKIIEE